jgi:Ca2+-binding RTX toxin-like protein
MALQYIATNITQTGASVNAVNLPDGDSLIIAPNVNVAATNLGYGVQTSGTAQIEVQGYLVGRRGIDARDAAVPANFSTLALQVGSQATISGVGLGAEAVYSVADVTTIINHGTIMGEFVGVFIRNSATIFNDGTITGRGSGIQMDAAGIDSCTITNSGYISGINSAFSGSNQSDTFRNSGTVVGQIDLGGGNDTYVNTGTVFGFVNGGVGFDQMTGGAGNDTMSGGDDGDQLSGGDGNDILSGGNNDDVIRGDAGRDILSGDGGNDTIYFSPEDEFVNGGTGSDAARNTYNDFGLTFDMGGNGFEQYYGSQAGETIVTTANIRMDVDAGGGNDLISGGAQGDGLSGGTGNDTIFGGLGPDQIGGGFGDDRIIGGIGADLIYGEQGNDTFVYNGVGDAGDTITDFEIGRDRIEILRSGFDLSLGTGTLAANRLVAGPANQAFGQFLLDTSTGNVFWDGDGTGAGTPTFLFQTQGVGGLNNTDFVVV